MDKKNKKRKKKVVKINKSTRICLLIVALFLFVLSVFLLINCIDTNKEDKEFIMNYKGNGGVSYKVYLKDNEHYHGTYLGMDQKYIAELIDYIDIDFNYSVELSRVANANYSYSIIATIVNENDSIDNDGVIWTKDYDLMDTVNGLITDTNVNIKEKIVLNYDLYNKIVKDFNKDYSILSKAMLNVKFNVKNNVTVNSFAEEIIGEDTIELNIPLLKNVIDIKKSSDVVINEDVYSDKLIVKDFNMFLFIASLLVVVLSLGLLIISIVKVATLFKVNKYVRKLNSILKNYGEIIAETTSAPSFSDKGIIEIKTFEDLVDIEEELRIPILLYEIKEGSESWFVIIHNDRIYRYTLKENMDSKNRIIRKIEGYKI